MKKIIPIHYKIQKKVINFINKVLDIDTDDILGLFITLVFYVSGFSILESLVYGIVGYLVYVRLEKTLFQHAIYLKKK